MLCLSEELCGDRLLGSTRARRRGGSPSPTVMAKVKDQAALQATPKLHSLVVQDSSYISEKI